MTIKLKQKTIYKRFGENACCRVSYQNKKKMVDTRLKYVDWKKCLLLTVLFDKPKYYLIDGSAAKRDGVRIIPLKD